LITCWPLSLSLSLFERRRVSLEDLVTPALHFPSSMDF